MIELLYKLFIGHNHKWKIIRQGTIGNGVGGTCGNWYDLRCEVCGDIKMKRNEL
jgi:hypothetical protein